MNARSTISDWLNAIRFAFFISVCEPVDNSIEDGALIRIKQPQIRPQCHSFLVYGSLGAHMSMEVFNVSPLVRRNVSETASACSCHRTSFRAKAHFNPRIHVEMLD